MHRSNWPVKILPSWTVWHADLPCFYYVRSSCSISGIIQTKGLIPMQKDAVASLLFPRGNFLSRSLDGAYERHVRRTRRAHEHRRAALLDVVEHITYLAAPPSPARRPGCMGCAGSRSCRRRMSPRWRPLPTARAWAYPVSPLFARPSSRAQPRAAGLILGCANLSGEEIDQGTRALAEVIAERGVKPRGRCRVRPSRRKRWTTT